MTTLTPKNDSQPPNPQPDGASPHPQLPQRSQSTTTSPSTNTPWKIPPPLARLFNQFPLKTYPTNTLPQRSPPDRSQNTLYIFTTTPNKPSYNPSCLKWQTYLLMSGIPFTTVPSTNHASPGGALPFLIPGGSAATAVPLTPSTLPVWIAAQSPPRSDFTLPRSQPASPASTRPTPKASPKAEMYTNLLTPLRHTYLYALYLHPSSFRPAAEQLYINTASSSSFVRTCLTPALRQAALDEVVKWGRGSAGGTIDVERLFREAEEAVGALGVVLGGCEWFGDVLRSSDTDADKGGQGGEGKEEEYDRTGPGMLDAAVFSYTHVILELFSEIAEGLEEEAWSPARRLVRAIEGERSLVRHRERVLEVYYRGYKGDQIASKDREKK